MATYDTAGDLVELAHRENDGIAVTLLWNPADGGIVVSVRDHEHLGFELEADPAHALDVYHHPFAYAAFMSVGDASAAEAVVAGRGAEL
jgi:hypothetical protein